MIKYLISKNLKYFITLIDIFTLFISACKEDTSLPEEITNKDITSKDKVSTNPVNKNSSNNPVKGEDDKFNEWLAGIIDGDGCFLLSKKGYASLEIVTQLRDKRCLYLIKQKYGGAVKLFAGDNHLRYRLHHKAGLLYLINGVNGLIRNPTRILQLGKICEKYGIELKDPQPLTYYNGWLAGFFDTDGSIYLNDKSGQIFITASQKNRFILEALVELYRPAARAPRSGAQRGGKIYTFPFGLRPLFIYMHSN